MGRVNNAVINLARRVQAKYSLKPPIDLESLIKEHAELIFLPIPIDGVDGISLNLKTKGRKAKVIVNTNNPPSRKRFTLAHELGHILIPWHTGSIIDHVDPAQAYDLFDYLELEPEANSFAAELLIPIDWMKQLLSETKDLALAHTIISNECQASLQAVAIRMAQILPKSIVYVVENFGVVEFSGRTSGTLANAITVESELNINAYNYCESHFTINVGNRNIHWWQLPDKIELGSLDDRSWRDILSAIVDDIGIPSSEAHKFKQSINGVVAAANSEIKGTENYSYGTVVAACMQRLKDREEYKDFVEHPQFENFLSKRSRDFVKTK